jgi:hypothetical protein
MRIGGHVPPLLEGKALREDLPASGLVRRWGGI